MSTKPPKEIRKVCLKSYVSEEEYEQIVSLSKQTDLSVSELTTRVLLGLENPVQRRLARIYGFT